MVAVDLDELRHTPLSGRSPRGDHAVTEDLAKLQARIETLEAELAKSEERSGGHRADFEHERERADRLVTELLKATSDLLAAREGTARLEGELAALRSIPKVERRRWWWQRRRSTG